MRPADALLSIVIPVLNEAATLPELERRILECASDWDVRWEVIFVDDGSTDDTPYALHLLHESDPRFKILTLSRNFGHQAAVTAGLDRATGDAVAILDADLQDPPEILQSFLDHWHAGNDVVYGVRKKRRGNIVRRTLYKAYYRILQYLADIPIPLDSGDFCLLDRRVVDAMQLLPERRRFVRGLRAWVGFRQIGVNYIRPARESGRSKYTIKKMLRLASDGIFAFSSKPLTLLSVFGTLTAALSFLGLAFFFVHRIVGFKIFGYSPSDVPGFTSVIFSILFIGGVQLLALGLVGKYIAHIVDEVKQRPLYLIKDSVGFDDNSAVPISRRSGKAERA